MIQQFITKENHFMNLLFAINTEFFQHFFVTLKSIEINSLNNNQIKVHVMYTNLEEHERNLVEECFKHFSFIWHSLQEYDFSQFFVNAHISAETYFRILAPHLIEEEKVIYLDSDLI